MGLDEVAIMLDRWYQPGGARFLSWQMFTEYKCLSAFFGFGFASGESDQGPVTGVEIPQNDKTSSGGEDDRHWWARSGLGSCVVGSTADGGPARAGPQIQSIGPVLGS